MVRGREGNRERRRLASELRAQGWTLTAIGERLGISRQAVQQLLKTAARRRVSCAGCGTAIVSAGVLPGDEGNTFCVACATGRPGIPLGQRLKAHRLAAGLTLSELARRAGMTPQRIAHYERELIRPTPVSAARLAQALGVEPEDPASGLCQPS
jgi:transcriptional regulator with XRE-family HTH domain